MTAFEEFGVLPELGKAVDDMGWTLPTDVQSEAIPLILGGGDVLMAAETGSGKTGAFCLPVLQIVWESLKDLQEGRVKSGKSAGGGAAESGSGWKMSFFDRGPHMAVTPDGLKTQSRHPKVIGTKIISLLQHYMRQSATLSILSVAVSQKMWKIK